MGVAEMRKIGGWIADILADLHNEALIASVRRQVAELTALFPVP